METRATHLLVELHGCSPALLNDVTALERILVDAVRAAGATVVGRLLHRFAPQGVTGVIVVEESHFSIHTWPERGYAAVDFFTCGDCRPELSVELVARALEASRHHVLDVERGREDLSPSLRVREVRDRP